MLHPDLIRLLDWLLPPAKQMLAEKTDFVPFGATMKQDGEILGATTTDGDNGAPLQISIESLTQSFRRKSRLGELRAAGICYDARTIPPGQTEKHDVLCASIEHQSGEALNVMLPYNKTGSDIQYGQMFTMPRTSQFFVANEPVGGWLFLLCFVLTIWSPAASLYYIFRHTIPTLINPHTFIRVLPLFIVYPVLFVPLAVFSFIAGLKLWRVKPGAVRIAKLYLLTFLGAHFAYFLVWVFWLLIFRPDRPVTFGEMGWGHLVVPTLHVAVWYSYLERSTRVRRTYLFG
jgi:hypothetical protein